MNLIQLETIKEVDRLLELTLQGKVENLKAIKRAKELTSDLIEYKDFNKHAAWKHAMDIDD